MLFFNSTEGSRNEFGVYDVYCTLYPSKQVSVLPETEAENFLLKINSYAGKIFGKQCILEFIHQRDQEMSLLF